MAIFARAGCATSICSVVALVYCAFTGLSRAWRGGPVVSVWYLALAITSDLSLLAPVGICHCAVCYVFIAKGEEERKFQKKTALPKALRSA